MRSAGCIALGLGLAAALLACGGDEAPKAADAPAARSSEPEVVATAAKRAPVIHGIRFEPRRPAAGDPITAVVEASDADGERVELIHHWFVDGRRKGETGPTLSLTSLRKGSVVQLEVIARDADGESAPASAIVHVGNRPPKLLGVQLEPSGSLTAADDVVATPRGEDPDGDALSYRFWWRINGEPVDEKGPMLPASRIRRGDRIELTLVANDGSDDSEPLRSQPIVVDNAPPRITSQPGRFDEGGVFRYAVAAEDPDGDRSLRYQLQAAPDGMEIDSVAGVVTWAPSPDQAGEHAVAVEVRDHSGGSARQQFTLHVAFEDVGAPAAPSP